MSVSKFVLTYRILPALALTILSQCGPTQSSAQVADPGAQIAAAVQAAPTEYRADATVYGFAGNGTLVTLREGTGDLICITDDPAKEGWSTACYHKSLEPFMAFGRDLRKQGITDSGEILKRRFEAAENGELTMPERPATLYVLTGDGFDVETDKVSNPYRRYVIYSPGATPETTGLATRPESPGQPWLMFPGTPGAHIMISPDKEDE
jgi:hypothetical protein